LELGALVMGDKGCTGVAMRRAREERRNTQENSCHNEDKLKFMILKCPFF
jgi:hypothetical protein